jgi:hypothetical protein
MKPGIWKRKTLSRKKDLEKFRRLKADNPAYTGFRGANTVTVKPQAALETVICSVCQRKRNVASETLPAERQTYVCQRCQDSQSPATLG